MILICTPCNMPVQDGQQAIYGADRGDGTLVFGWACCHKPVGDVAVVISSAKCLEHWLRENPQYTEPIGKLFASIHTHSRGK